MPKQRKQAKVEINQQNCHSVKRAFVELRAGNILSKKLVRQKCKQIAKAYDLKLDMRGCAFSIVSELFKNSGEDLKLFTKSLRIVQQHKRENIIIFSDVYDGQPHVPRDKIKTFVAKCLAAGITVSAFEHHYPKLEFGQGYKPHQTIKIYNGGHEQLFRGNLVGLIIGEDEHVEVDAYVGGGLDDEYAYWAETMRECGCTPVGNPFDWNYGRDAEPPESKTDEVVADQRSGVETDCPDITQEQAELLQVHAEQQIHAEQFLKDLTTEFGELGPVPNNVRIYVQDGNYCKYFGSELVTGTVLGQTVFYLRTEVSGVSVQWLIFFDKNGKPHWKHNYDFYVRNFSSCMENMKSIWRCDEESDDSFPFVDNVEGITFDWRTGGIDYTCQIDMFIGNEWFQVCDKRCDCEYCCYECDGPLACHVARKKQALQDKQEAVQATIYQEFEKLPVTSTTRRCFQTISRKGQPKMRQELLNEFASTCPATGENNEEYLEAAHLVPFRDIQDCESANGLLLDLKIHKALDSGHLTYDGNGQLWRRHNFNIQHLHICNAQLPSRLLTDKRKNWLEQAYRGWLTHHNTSGTELCKVITD